MLLPTGVISPVPKGHKRPKFLTDAVQSYLIKHAQAVGPHRASIHTHELCTQVFKPYGSKIFGENFVCVERKLSFFLESGAKSLTTIEVEFALHLFKVDDAKFYYMKIYIYMCVLYTYIYYGACKFHEF